MIDRIRTFAGDKERQVVRSCRERLAASRVRFQDSQRSGAVQSLEFKSQQPGDQGGDVFQAHQWNARTGPDS